MRHQARRTSIAVLVTTLLLLATACSSASAPGSTTSIEPTASVATIPAAGVDSSGAEFTVRASDFGFEAPDRFRAGQAAITLVNDGRESHFLALARIKDSESLANVTGAVLGGEDPSRFVDYYGGPGAVAPGARQQVTVNLDPGGYLLLCTLRTVEGKTHASLGQYRPLDVTSPSGPAVAPPPTDLPISFRDFAFIVTAEVKAGKQVWRVTNDGMDDHELMLVRPAPGWTYQDIFAHFSTGAAGPPPIQNSGGFQRIGRGKGGWISLDLTPGIYAMVCTIPNDATGRVHSQLGMIRQVEVK